MLAAAEHLANHIHEAPVWIVPCLEGATPTRTSGSSIYPAVQNMLLAARALGLGATLTTLYLNFEKEAEAALGLPPDVHSYVLRSDMTLVDAQTGVILPEIHSNQYRPGSVPARTERSARHRYCPIVCHGCPEIWKPIFASPKISPRM